jgi:hypothetical protein
MESSDLGVTRVRQMTTLRSAEKTIETLLCSAGRTANYYGVLEVYWIQQSWEYAEKRQSCSVLQSICNKPVGKNNLKTFSFDSPM